MQFLICHLNTSYAKWIRLYKYTRLKRRLRNNNIIQKKRPLHHLCLYKCPHFKLCMKNKEC